jgi:hypothetical protein
MPSPTDFNLSPYYDDFTESKKFHRILFRPGFAVQARELTQAQSILQNQIERFGDHVFKQGAMIIPGQLAFDTEFEAVKLTSKSAASVNSYVNFIVTGATSGAEAQVVKAVANDGTNPDTLFVKYDNTGNNTTVRFQAGETITITADGQGTAVISGATAVVSAVATGSAASVASGVYYINGFFVQNDKETIILDPYTNSPSYRIGFAVTESFITPNDDASLNDNAQGSSNVSAPGAHRLKISLTLTKKTIASTEDSNFVEIGRIENGEIKSLVRKTEYSVLEETLARRTFDESGDYTLGNPDIDIREHLIDGTNRGIFTSANGGSESKLAIGVSPFKAYVKGYEVDIISTIFTSMDKARDFEDQNNNKTRYNVKNFVNVSNVYGSPDIGFVSGIVEPFKKINLYDTATSVRGTERSNSGTTVPQIGIAKSRGFEFISGTETNDIFNTSSIFRHYLFDIEMFTHLNVRTAQSFTVGEIVSGATSGATGVVRNISTTNSIAVTSLSVASPTVVTLNNHGFADGQQITLSGGSFQVDSTAYTEGVYVVRNATTNTFELFESNGTTPINVTSFSSAPTIAHGVVVISDVKGIFNAGETITGGSSSDTAVIQSDTLGFLGVQSKEFSTVKQIGMAGSPTYTADTILDTTSGDGLVLLGNISISNSDATILGKGTSFQTDLRIGDKISFTNDAGNNVNGIVKYIVSQTELELTANVGGSDVTSAGIITRLRAKLQNPESNISIFELPYRVIKTLKTSANSGLSDTNFNVRRNFVVTLSSNGDGTITAGTNEIFASLSADDFSATITTLGAGITGAAGDVLNLSGNNHESDPIFVLGGSPVGKTLTLDFGGNFQGHTIKVIATIQRNVASSKTKTLVENSTISKTSQLEIQSGTIGLGKADVYNVDAVYMSADFSTPATSSDTNITSRFDLDTGQRDNYYDIGRLKLKPGAITPTGQLLVQFDFFSHGAGDYFDVDSYSGVIDYEDIPSYTSDTTGETFILRDVLDFRPRVDDASSIPGTITGSDYERSFDGTGNSIVDVVQFNSDITTDFEYYLNRIDKLFLTTQGQFKLIKGSSGLTPTVPKNLDTAIHLATFNVPAYTLSPSDVNITQVDNKRYTMRDIGRLEKRIQNVEYYTQLSLLETNAQSLQIQDADGFDRFKNGFVVDNFTGHNIGDVGNNDYKLAIDRTRGEGRTMFNQDVVELEERDDDETEIVNADRTEAGYQKTGDLITLPFTEVTYIEQPYATRLENLNPFAIFDWVGNIELNPAVDEWIDTDRAPDLVVNLNGSWDNLVENRGLNNNTTSSIPFGTEWNNWQTNWTGSPSSREVVEGNQIVRYTSTNIIQTRSGIQTNLVPQTVVQSLGERVISVAFVPFIRQRDITFTARGMRPNTRVYPFFDNEDVTTYVAPTNGSFGGNLNTDNNGTLTGTFALPSPNIAGNPRWRTGTRVFRLTSSSDNTLDRSEIDTSAEGDYVAKGLLQTVQESFASTREVSTVRVTTSQSQNVTNTSRTVIGIIQDQGGGGADPLAQSFIIDQADGVFITSVDVFFQARCRIEPVKVEIRNMVNGYPGSQVVPFSVKWKDRADVAVSEDASLATTFTFDSPVYLQEGVEYCIILFSHSPNYVVHISRLGETVINSDRKVSEQPNVGILFKSANYRTWSPDQMEDLKFKIKRASFTTSSSNVVTLSNATLPSKTLVSNPIRTFNGSSLVRIFHRSHGMHSTTDNVTIAGLVSGTSYNGILGSQINGTYTSISNITLDSYDITTSGTATATGDVGGTTVTATQNRLFDVAQLQMGTLLLPNTNITTTIRTTTGKSVHGSEVAFTKQSASLAKSIVNGDNIYFTEPKLVASAINETNEMGSTSTAPVKSLIIKASMTSTNERLSPIIDTKRLNLFAISNRLNNPVVSFTDTFTGDGSTVAFTLSGAPSSVHLLSVKQNGKPLAPIDDFTVSGSTLTLDTAPPSNSKVIVKLTNTVNFEEDTANEGGSTAGSYLTKPINIENPSTALDIRVAASVRTTSSIKAFFRITGGEEVRRIQDIPYTAFNLDGSPDVTVNPSTGEQVLDNDFRDYKFSVNNLPEFTSFQIKIIFRGTNSSYPARIKDFRGIALAL